MKTIKIYTSDYDQVNITIDTVKLNGMSNFDKLQYSRQLARENNVKYANDIYGTLINM